MKLVTYVGKDGEEEVAIRIDADGPNADLLVLADGEVPKLQKGVARRAPSEFGAEGGGHTWHEK